MVELDSTGLTMGDYPAEKGKKFGITLGIAFAALAVILFWRDRRTSALIVGILASALLIAAIVFPVRLEYVERAWMRLAHLLSRVTTPIFMGIVYFLILSPVGFIRRTAGKNPLVHDADGDSYWKPRTPLPPEKAAARMERQF